MNVAMNLYKLQLFHIYLGNFVILYVLNTEQWAEMDESAEQAGNIGEFLLPCDASAERGDATVSRPSVCLSVCNDQVPWTHRLEFFENNFTAE